MKKVIRLTESDLEKIVKKVIEEQTEMANYNRAIQCFLNKKKITDDEGKPLKIDGSIGNYPNSKTAQAIYKYQRTIGVRADGGMGPDTYSKMPMADKNLFKKCVSEHGDLVDKITHWLNLD